MIEYNWISLQLNCYFMYYAEDWVLYYELLIFSSKTIIYYYLQNVNKVNSITLRNCG